MRILFLVVLFILTLDARENPFATTETYEEKKTQMLKQLYEIEAQEEAVKAQAIMAAKNEQMLKEQEAKKAQEAAKLAEEEKKKSPFTVKKGCQEKYEYTPLSFVKVKTDIDSVSVVIDSKFKLLSQDILEDNNKLIYDFKGNLIFYTQRLNLCHNYFKSLAIGNHPKNGYFRVVLEVSDSVAKYEESVDTKKSIVKVYRKPPAK